MSLERKHDMITKIGHLAGLVSGYVVWGWEWVLGRAPRPVVRWHHEEQQ